jgi:Leucine-rich repeat (LRR) protein
MKNLSIFLAIALIGFIGNAQIVNIPDVNFKAKLLASDHTPFNAFAFGFDQQAFKLDVNNDGEIQVSEAQMVIQLNISQSNIADLTGIESFTNLIVLNCNNNALTNLNLNSLPTITVLQCQNNQLSSLDVRGLTGLGYLNCSDNQLTSLYIKNGSNESSGLAFANNPNLQYICADTSQFSTVSNRILQYGYLNCTYDANCSALATENFDVTSDFVLHPNPAKNILSIDRKTPIKITSVNIFNMLGQMIMAVPNTEVASFDVSDLRTGTYFIKIVSDKGTVYNKFVKE